MTVALPWSSVGRSTGYRGNPRVSTARATAFHCTWRSTASATIVAMARTTVLSVATSAVPIMATHGSTTATVTAYSMATSMPWAVGIALGRSVVPRPAVVCRGCLPWDAVEFAVDLAVEIALASAMRLHNAPLLAAAFRGSPWNVRGSQWSVHGCP